MSCVFLKNKWDFSGCPVVGAQRFHCSGLGSVPSGGTEVLQAKRKARKEKNNNKNNPRVSFEKEILYLNKNNKKIRVRVLLVL